MQIIRSKALYGSSRGDTEVLDPSVSSTMTLSQQFPRPSYNQLEKMYYQLVAEKDDILNQLAAAQEELEKVRHYVNGSHSAESIRPRVNALFC